MDTGWSAHFRRAGCLRYRASRVLYFEQPQDEGCGLPCRAGRGGSTVTRRATPLVFPSRAWIEGRTDCYR
ncbi:hypothetical protein [Nonomuraea dietziae]|uniref:hypothetical protein n=1 Tax=Nonomuraea dietziae TaxID=65515 RepID=UPI0031DD33D9